MESRDEMQKQIEDNLRKRIAGETGRAIDRNDQIEGIDYEDHPLIETPEMICAALSKRIDDFSESLDQSHEVGVRLASLGQTSFRLRRVEYCAPSLITFKGVTEHNEPVELIQHINQISILCVKLARPDPSAHKQKIDFKV